MHDVVIRDCNLSDVPSIMSLGKPRPYDEEKAREFLNEAPGAIINVTRVRSMTFNPPPEWWWDSAQVKAHQNIWKDVKEDWKAANGNEPLTLHYPSSNKNICSNFKPGARRFLIQRFSRAECDHGSGSCAIRAPILAHGVPPHHYTKLPPDYLAALKTTNGFFQAVKGSIRPAPAKPMEQLLESLLPTNNVQEVGVVDWFPLPKSYDDIKYQNFSVLVREAQSNDTGSLLNIILCVSGKCYRPGGGHSRGNLSEITFSVTNNEWPAIRDYLEAYPKCWENY